MNCIDKGGRGTRWTVALDRAAAHGLHRDPRSARSINLTLENSNPGAEAEQ